MIRKLEPNIKNCFKNNNHNCDVINTRSLNKENNLFIQYNKNLTKIKKRGGNEGEENESEIDVERDAMSDDNDETIKSDHYFENLCRN